MTLRLDVGGKRFKTHLSTLELVPVLHRRFTTELSLPKEDNVYFLDRDPIAFAAFLKALRGYRLLNDEQPLAKQEAEYWSTTLPSTAIPSRAFVLEDRIVQVSNQMLELLPLLKSALDTTILRKDGYPVVGHAETFGALQELSIVLATGQEMHPSNWHRLRIWGLVERLPLIQIIPKLDQYVQEYDFMLKHDEHGQQQRIRVLLQDKTIAILDYQRASVNLAELNRDHFHGLLCHVAPTGFVGYTVRFTWK